MAGVERLTLIAGLAFLASPAIAANPDFDRAPDAAAALAAAREASRSQPSVPTESAPAQDDALWVSIGRSDLVQPSWRGSPLGAPVLTSQRAAVFRVPVEKLPELSRFMHDKFGRCGGYFAHESRPEAEEDLSAPPPASAGPYTVDQGEVARPIAAAVRESDIRSTIETLAAFHNRYYQADTGVQAADWIRGRWAELAAGLPGAWAATVSHGWKQPSVVLTIPGTEQPDEHVILGGHLDSINGWGSSAARAPGADDNASGIAVLTEAIRVLAAAGWRPKRTVQFMGYAAEEVGLRGSKEIAARYAREGKGVVGVVQFDMTNYKGSGDEIYILDDNVDPKLSEFLGRLVDVYAGAARNSTRCGYGCSDHAAWTRSGFAASAAFESAFDTMNRSIHTERDTLANSGGDARHSVPFARLAAAFAIELAKTAGSAGALTGGGADAPGALAGGGADAPGALAGGGADAPGALAPGVSGR